jgi:protein involved in temperature-dependent protein secretion
MDDMTHDDQQELQRAQAQFHQAVNDLLAVKQDLARQQQTFALLQRMSPEVAQRIGRSLFDQLLKAKCDRAAEEATREFPEYLQEVRKRRAPRGKP